MIKAIIFDLGGVLYDIDYQLTIAAFGRLGLSEPDKHFSQMRQSTLFDHYEVGKISTETFINEIKAMLPNSVTYGDVEKAWNEILIGITQETLDFLEETKAKIPTFLLSNTNALHIETVNQGLIRDFGVDSLHRYFHQVYYSYEAGLRKPDPAIFQKVLAEQNIKPETTLFIDDSPQHIATAQSLGIQTFLFKPRLDDIQLVVNEALGIWFFSHFNAEHI